MRIQYLRSVYAIAEVLVHMKLSDQSKAVLENYLDSSGAETMSGKARDAIYRYTEIRLPALTEIKERNTAGRMANLDHLIAKMEYAARRLDSEAPQ